MIVEGDELPNGWPLGLGNLNSRIRLADTTSSQPVAPPPQPNSGPRLILLRSTSFSSFSSSSLDTESTSSFFPDRSVSLGRLIGIRPTNKKLYDKMHIQNRPSSSDDNSCGRVGRNDEENSQGICVPLLHNMIGRMSRSRSRNSSYNYQH